MSKQVLKVKGSSVANPSISNKQHQAKRLICKGKNMPKMDLIGHADPYVILMMDGRSRRTEFVKNDANPVWHQTLEFDYPIKEDLANKTIDLTCYDHDFGKKDDFIGKVHIPVAKYLDGNTHSDLWFDLANEDGATGASGSVLLEITLVKV